MFDRVEGIEMVRIQYCYCSESSFNSFRGMEGNVSYFAKFQDSAVSDL